MTKANGTWVKMTDGTLHKVPVRNLDHLLQLIAAMPQEPLYLYYPDTQKYLYYDAAAIASYKAGNIDIHDLRELLECEGLYRNKEAVTAGSVEIDPHSLWRLVKDGMELVDYDHHIRVAHISDVFYEV